MIKRVLFVISSLKDGGAERALSNITTNFPDDWEIDILVNDDKIIDYPYKGNVITLGLTKKSGTNILLFQLRVLINRIIKLKSLKKEKKYQACISFMDSANVANVLSGKKYCHVILSVRISLKQSARNPQYKYIVNPLATIFYNMADKIIAVSEGVRQELITDFSLNKEKVVTIENGYNLLEIRKQGQEELTEQEKKIIMGKKVIATTGRLSAQKGQWHLIRALTEVVKQIPDVILIIIGNGELEGYLKQLSKACKVDKNIFFAGHVSNPYKYLRYSDIFVFPSMFEGFPNALAEAVCMELPCISTDFRTGAREILAPDMNVQGSGIRGILEVEYGILTPLCSGKQYQDLSKPLEQAEKYLAEAMIRLLVSEQKRNAYRQKCQLRSEKLKINTVVNKWVAVVEDIGDVEKNKKKSKKIFGSQNIKSIK